MKKVLKIGAALIALLVVGIGGFVGIKMATANFSHPDTPMPDIRASTDPDVIARGEYIVHNVAHCSTCHQGIEHFKTKSPTVSVNFDAPLSGGYTIDMGPFAKVVVANITPDPETGIGNHTDGEIARAVRYGVSRNGDIGMMRFALGPMSDEDLTAVVSWLRAQPPVKAQRGSNEWGPIAKMISSSLLPRATEPPKHVPPADEPSIERGRYLAQGPALCEGCHTPLDPMAGFAPAGPPLSGGSPEPDAADPENMVYVAPNLTSDPTGRTGQWDEEQFVKRMKGGRVFDSSIMAWEAFARMTDSDLRSIYRYIKSVPPVSNDTGESRRPK